MLTFAGDWFPYFYKVSNAKYDGSDYQFLAQVLNEMGCDFVVLPMNETRTGRELRKGTFDMSIGASFTDARAQDYYYSDPYRDEIIGFAIRHDGAGLTPETPFEHAIASGKKVAMNVNGYFGEFVEQLRAGSPKLFVHAFGLKQRLNWLAQGKVDAVVDDRIALCMQYAAENPAKWRVADQLLYQNSVHFIFNKHSVSEAWVARFNQYLESHRTHSDANSPPTQC
ncbi:substrate-binding periplasmic protein [Alteromonas facilis]|uniref:substrate-binding periplasmic protein n=1 Tax=Alteromonas facilis TaxID=2048004 RepID=UPI0013DAADEA|nr:transporter substrate-binding domain-containing protein [Alteromonas facilis]